MTPEIAGMKVILTRKHITQDDIEEIKILAFSADLFLSTIAGMNYARKIHAICEIAEQYMDKHGKTASYDVISVVKPDAQ